MVSTVNPPALSFFATLLVEVGQPIDLGRTPLGERRIVPINGGTVSGDGWSGRVVPGGADFQLHPDDHLSHLQARYAVETDSGTHLYVDNTALRCGSPDDVAALMRGEHVDPSRIYFRCWPRVHAPIGSEFEWLNERLCVGTGQREPDRVRIDVFVLE
ncbi:MAG: DUF3237 domain-containing protein [Dermatophilaceae bacterium]